MESSKERARYVGNKSLKTITIVSLSIIIVLFVIQWICIYHNISKVKLAQENLAKSKQEVTTFYFNFSKTKDKQILLSPEEFKKMYEHVNALADIVSKESQRTQDIINQDIDRLNLYMAIGIGFISILGIFVPLFINVLSFDDIKNKQRELEEDEENLNGKYDELIKKVKEIPTDKIGLAIEKSTLIDEIVPKVESIEKTMESSVPKVSTLILQQAIIRYFTVVPYLIIDSDSKRFIDIINAIKLGFNQCNNTNNHSVINNEPLKTLLLDFSNEINSGRSLTIALNPEMIDIYLKLSVALRNHVVVKSIQEEKESNKNIVEIFEELIKVINNYYAKIESAA